MEKISCALKDAKILTNDDRKGTRSELSGEDLENDLKSVADVAVSQAGEKIAAWLDPEELLTLLSVCKSFHSTFGSNTVFKPVVERTFPNASKPRFYGAEGSKVQPNFWRRRFIDLMEDQLIEHNLMYEIRVATVGDLQEFYKRAHAEEWQPGPHDLAAFFALDPKGFFLGVLDGEVVGCCSGVAYDDTYGFIGYYIVDPAHRGMGYGLPLFKRALARLGSDRNIGLDGEPEQVGNYVKSGFTSHYESVRFKIEVQDFSRLHGQHVHVLVSSREIDMAAIAAYDAKSHATPRPRLLEEWACIAGTIGFVALAEGGAIIKGYGFMRPLADAETNGWRIGPLVADSPGVAAALLQRFCQQLSTTTALYLDVPDANANALALMDTVCATRVHACTRMYNHSPPAVAMHKCFAHLSLEVG